MNDGTVQIQPGNTKPLEVEGKVFKSAFDWELSEKDLERAARELGETEEKKRTGLRELKEKLSDESNIRYRLDDFYLLRFLRVRKYDVSRAYQNVKHFYEKRKKHSDFFIIPQDMKSALQMKWFTILPYADEDGRILILLNFNRWDPYEKTFEEMIQTAANVADFLSMNPKSQINGFVAIYDLKGITFKHMTELLWNGRLFACVPIAQNGYPWRIKKFILINTNRPVRILYDLLKPLATSKLVQRCVLLGSDVDELHQLVNPVLLPKRLGGSLEEEECDITQYVLNNLEYIKYERSFIFE